MSGLPVVSIVTPTLNQGRFLRRAIDSVLRQDHPRIEYIVMDGGSTDDTCAILQSYGDRVRWISRPDDGQADAINQGFSMSSGEIRAYLNSDDVLLPGAVSAAARQLAAHPEWDLLYGDALLVDEGDAVTGRYATADFSSAALWREDIICQPAAFWRRSAADRIGPFDAHLHYVMDYEYWLRMDAAGLTLAHVRTDLAASRLHPDAKTIAGRQGIFEELLSLRSRFGRPVGRTYYIGYWRHRLGAGGALARTLGRWRRVSQALGALHYTAARYASNMRRSPSGVRPRVFRNAEAPAARRPEADH